jgi:hypothetical protein
MRSATVQQKVTVNRQASSITTGPIDTASASLQSIISSKDLETIPLAHRSFANIAYLAPGTEPVEPSDPTKARITAVSFGGSSGLNVELSVDGGDNSDDYIGGFLQNISPDAIQEFAVRTAQEDADTGRTTAGSVVISTRRGTDTWHGDTAFYERAAALNARYPIENPAPDPKQPFSRQNYVGTLGGPIEPGRLWFFSSFEYVHEDASIAYSPASQSQFDALAQLAQMGLIPHVNDCGAEQRSDSVSRLSRHSSFRLVAIRALAVVSAGRRRQLHHRKRSGAASYAAFHGHHVALELPESTSEPAVHFQPHMARLTHI